MPKFSIIIPVYNAAKYLRECLDSVLAQTYTDFEVICVDDESTDESGKILDEYARRDSRFIVVHKKNGGVGSARNAGLARATGDYITFLDNDDLICRDWFAAAARVIKEKNPDLLRFETQYQVEEPEGFANRKLDCPVETYEGAEAFRFAWKFIAHRGFVWLCFIKREIIQGLEFDPRLKVKDDVVFLASTFPKLQRICYAEFRGHFYRNTPGSGIKARRHAIQCSSFVSDFRKLFEDQRDYADQIGFGDDLRRLIVYGVRHDIIEWACRPAADETCAKQLIRDEYVRLRLFVRRRVNWSNKLRYLPGFVVWQICGWMGLIVACEWMEKIVRRIR
mgnify:CR=1 FL=1